jgi:hypothetical protein
MNDSTTGQAFKILSIDGGGVKGLYCSTILEKMEEKFDCRIGDYFDLLCGTSTGGLIALALSLNIPAKEISDFYRTDGPRIFPADPKWYAFLKQALLAGKYGDKELRKSLYRIFGDRKIGESNNLLCIPSYCVTHADNYVFKFDHPEGNLDRDNERSYVDVALATSAAPTYFPVAQISSIHNTQFVDGGVWANNPTLVGLIEALKYFVPSPRYSGIKLLSISSINLYEGKALLNRHRSFRHWKGDLFQTSISGQSNFTHYFMKSIGNSLKVPVDYVRIPSEQVSSHQEHLVQLDVATPASLDLISSLGLRAAEIQVKTPAISDFFESPKIYQPIKS